MCEMDKGTSIDRKNITGNIEFGKFVKESLSIVELKERIYFVIIALAVFLNSLKYDTNRRGKRI